MAPMHFSLKWLMIAVAMAAATFAALVNASGAWAMAIITAIIAFLLAAASVAAAGAGRSQAFAKGFLVGTLFYFLLWIAASHDWFGVGNSGLLATGDLVTERIVNRLYDLVKRETPAAAPPASGMMPGGSMGGPGMMSGMPGGDSAGGMGMGMMMGGGMMGMPGPTLTPDSYQFHKIAHWLIAFYFGLASGLFTMRLRSARSVA